MDALEGGAPGYYPFDTVAPLHPNTAQGIARLGGYGGDIADQVTGSGLRGLNLLDRYYGSPVSSPQVTNDAIANFYNSDLVNSHIDTAADTAQTFLDRYLGNDIASGAIATGNTGSSRRGILEGQAIADTATGLANTVADIQGNAYDQAIALAGGNAELVHGTNNLNAGNMSAYAGLTGNNITSGYNFGGSNINNLLAAGSMLQAQDQNQINARMNEHMWDYSQDWDLLNRYYGIASPFYGHTNSTTSSTQSYRPGAIEVATALGSAALGGGYSAPSPQPAQPFQPQVMPQQPGQSNANFSPVAQPNYFG